MTLTYPYVDDSLIESQFGYIMALSFFDLDNESSSNGDKLFAKDFLAKNPKEIGKQFPIKELKFAKSGKGYMVHTDYFIIWLWKRSSVTQHLLEALTQYTQTGKGYALFAVLDKNAKDGYQLAIDPEIECSWYDMGNESYSLNIPSSTVTSGNPFLPAVYPLPTEEAPVPQRKGGGRQQ